MVTTEDIIQKKLLANGFEVSLREHVGRVDRFLARLLSSWSRSMVNDLIREGGVSVSGRVIKKGSKGLKRGEIVNVDPDVFERVKKELRTARAVKGFAFTGDKSAVTPEDIPLDILYENEDLLIVVKPSGMVVHPAYANRKGTLVNAVAGYFKRKSIKKPHRVGLVHRLDKDVSGLMIIAKNDWALRMLSKQFSGKNITPESGVSLTMKAHKQYWAEVEELQDGCWERMQFDTKKWKKVHGYIRRDKQDRKKSRFIVYPREFRGGGTAKYALSYMRLKERLGEGRYLLDIQIVTGRTHQIRAQCASMRLPVVCDDRYGARSHDECKKNKGIKLRCVRLSFIPPAVYEYIEKTGKFDRSSDWDKRYPEEVIEIQGKDGVGVFRTEMSSEDGCLRSTIEYCVRP